MAKSTLTMMLAASAALLPGCDRADPPSGAKTAQANIAADQQAIRAISQRWAELIRARDASGIAQFYAEDAMVLPQGLPAFRGRDAITEWWATDMATPGYDLTSRTAEIIVAASGDLAVERGTYRYRARLADGPIERRGKFVTTWRRIGGEWKVALEIYNLDHSAELRVQ